MLVTGPEQSAAMIREILDNRPGPPRNIVIANAAAALWTASRDQSLTKLRPPRRRNHRRRRRA